ncbi:TnpV protein [Ruminococcus sp. OA3]|uniref:TnpV protein n=1 Tax=Ruminococcus sp. OA3 TaxID=2914164 RepID=UPI0023DD258A|nr:TnpV protein [Ruminococcus sp. OA3]
MFYTELLTSCKLNSYLAEIDEQASEMLSRLVRQIAERESVTETLKVENQMIWVGQMNNIRSSVTEIVNTELINNSFCLTFTISKEVDCC